MKALTYILPRSSVLTLDLRGTHTFIVIVAGFYDVQTQILGAKEWRPSRKFSHVVKFTRSI